MKLPIKVLPLQKRVPRISVLNLLAVIYGFAILPCSSYTAESTALNQGQHTIDNPSIETLKTKYGKLPNEENAIALADAYFYDALEKAESDQEAEFMMGIRVLESVQTKGEKSAEVLARLARIWGRIAIHRGGKEKIKIGKLVKTLADEAYTLDPENRITNLVLGVWHYQLANLSGIERFFGSVLFGDIPQGDLNSSLKYLLAANKPGKESVFSQFALAQTWIALGQRKEAKSVIKKGLELKEIYKDDFRIKRTMQAMLKNLGA